MLEKRFQDLKYIGLSGAIHSSIRLDAMKRMDAGDLDVILTTRVFGKGVDVKSIDFIVDATGVPSRNSTLQRYGRGARKTEGKNGLIYVDIADRGSKFEDAAHARLRALKEVGGPIVRVTWKGDNAEEVLDLTIGGGRKQWPPQKPQEITT
jgi:superfamily II DNA or RNA helicase